MGTSWFTDDEHHRMHRDHIPHLHNQTSAQGKVLGLIIALVCAGLMIALMFWIAVVVLMP